MPSDQDVQKFRERYFSLIEEQEKKKQIMLKQIRQGKEDGTIDDVDTPRRESIEKLKQQEREEQFTQLYQAVIEKREKEEQIEDLQGRTDNGDQCKKEEEKRAEQEQQKARELQEEIKKQAEEESLKAIAEDKTLRTILGLNEDADPETIREAIKKFFNTNKDNREEIKTQLKKEDHPDLDIKELCTLIDTLFNEYDTLLSKNNSELSIEGLIDILRSQQKPTTTYLGSLSPGNG
ncbi:MAG: hypothetical protein CMF55_02015 [Legionellales bacterium]|nr:hypothetical protein [Legionellales bacterium]|tara:strand:- start:536 stop:1240 length:705 start_codon:yes stop_codon:yes gene_type:complete